MKTKLFTQTLAIAMLLFVNFLQGQTSFSGVVSDSETNEVIPGVNVIIQGTSEGTVSDFDGNFELKTSMQPPFTIEISSVGFETKSVEVTENDQQITVLLDAGQNLDEIIVTASRRPQKVQDAPSSVSLISAKDIENSAVAVDPVRHLQYIPGVQLQQQSANTINIEMRAGSGVFGTSTLPMLDYRFLSTPAAGTFFSQQAGLSNIDIEKIEVVRGAASALYGPGVASGVVHFMSKSAIDHPGTTIELMSGTLNTRGAALRHAYSSENKKIGFKINAKWAAGDDFEMDPVKSASIISGFSRDIAQPVVRNKMVDPTQRGEILLSFQDLDDNNDGNPLATKYENFGVNAHLELRPNDDTSAFLSGGMAQGGAIFFNSQGTGYQDGKDYWAQARVQTGGLFGQVFYNYNPGGDAENPTFLYDSGFRQVAKRSTIEAQLQYNFDVPGFLNTNFTVGADLRDVTSDTEYTLFGRSDDDDDYRILGGYVQGTSILTDKLELTYAARFDTFNILDENGFSPRVALVYKIDENNTIRASYNSATLPPTALQAFIDFPVNTIVPGVYDVWLAGENEAQNFDANAPIEFPLLGGQTLPQGSTSIPNALLYNALTANPLTVAGMTQAYNALPDFQSLRALQAGLNAVPGVQLDFLSMLTGQLAGFSPTGSWAQIGPGYNIFNPPSATSPGELFTGGGVDAPSAQLGTLNSFEIGYNGIIAKKLKVMVDFYTYERKGFTSFTGLGPTYGIGGTNSAAFAATVGSELGAAVAPIVTAEMTAAYQTIADANGLPFSVVAGGNVPGVPALAPTIAAAAGGLGLLAGGTYQQGAEGFESIASALYPLFGTIESQRVPQGDGVTHIPSGYRKFADATRSHYGIDVAFEYFATDAITFWANGSYVSQNVWRPGESDDDDLPFPSFLNSPQKKMRAGMRYSKGGVFGSVAYQYDESFESNQGVWGGMTDEKNLWDANIGYRFENGMRIDITGSNILDFKYSAFPGMPVIGRRIIGKITFDL